MAATANPNFETRGIQRGRKKTNSLSHVTLCTKLAIGTRMEALDPYVSLTLEDSIVISSSSSSQGESPSSNIITTARFQSSTSADQSWQYIRIGAHYFRSLVSSSSATADITSQTTRRITHLPNRFDQSPTAQFPTIRTGDSVQTFDASNNTDDASLSACIASSFAADIICPVPSCRQELSS
jgi:hypothetical protein